MADTGWISPSSVTQEILGYAWSNPSNAMTLDGATSDLTLPAYNGGPARLQPLFNFGLPAKYIVTGIEISFTRKNTETSTFATWYGFQLSIFDNTGYKYDRNTNSNSGSLVTSIFGGPGDMWNITPGTLNDSFSYSRPLNINVLKEDNRSVTWYVDFVKMKLYYDVPQRDYYVNSSGIWKPADPLSVKDAGVWKDVNQLSIRDAGVWKKVYGI